MRLIDANKLIKHLNDWQFSEGCEEGWNYKEDKTVPDYERQIAIYRTIDQCISAVMDQPSVEAELVRHGHWIRPYHDHYKQCSVCERVHYTIPWNAEYCPFCGAKMDGGDL